LNLCNEEAWGAEYKGHPKVLEDNFEWQDLRLTH
jgi:hypothetical protein